MRLSSANIVVLTLALLAGFSAEVFAQGSISGRVTGSDTPPLASRNTLMRFFSDSGRRAPSAPTTTDAPGELHRQSAGRQLRGRDAEQAGCYINEIYNNVPCSAVCNPDLATSTTVTNAAVTGIDFVLDPGSRISGTVTDSVSGLPIARVMVGFGDANAQLFFTSAITDASGNYISEGGSATGNVYAMTLNGLGYFNEVYDNVRCQGCDPSEVGTPIPILLGTPKTGINFALELGGRITGTVTNSNGQPLANVEINVFDSTGEQVDELGTDASGSYATGSLASGTYYIAADGFGVVDELFDDKLCANTFCDRLTGTPITVTSPATTSNINFVLSPGGTVTGKVTAAAWRRANRGRVRRVLERDHDAWTHVRLHRIHRWRPDERCL